ncbi:hypothetical protein HDU82_002125 [Entophlyctis luteolus]|nr:hypothetical protein HDU82_002125 [Entophlyctis luteolus]
MSSPTAAIGQQQQQQNQQQQQQQQQHVQKTQKRRQQFVLTATENNTLALARAGGDVDESNDDADAADGARGKLRDDDGHADDAPPVSRQRALAASHLAVMQVMSVAAARDSSSPLRLVCALLGLALSETSTISKRLNAQTPSPLLITPPNIQQQQHIRAAAPKDPGLAASDLLKRVLDFCLSDEADDELISTFIMHIDRLLELAKAGSTASIDGYALKGLKLVGCVDWEENNPIPPFLTKY